MKAVISTTYDDNYFWFVPLTTWLWNKLGVEVLLFKPFLHEYHSIKSEKFNLIQNLRRDGIIKLTSLSFVSPENKEATYAQCVRLYAACKSKQADLDLPEDEILITSDIDMGVFKIPDYVKGTFSVFGADLVPEGQVPICFLTATVKQWRDTFNLYGKSYQQCLDELLGDIECENMRGNYWSKDQQEAYDKIHHNRFSHTEIKRAKEGTQFASNRYDRDDAYILDRLSPDTIDYHMNRSGFEDRNFEIILTIMYYHFPDEDFQWLIDYNEQYKKLL
jgi:hypothetical protein